MSYLPQHLLLVSDAPRVKRRNRAAAAIMALVVGPFRTQFAQPIPQAFTMCVVLVSGTQTMS